VNSKPPLSYALAFGWTLGAAICLQWLLRASVALRPSAATDVVALGGVEALVFVLGILAVVSLHGRDVPLSASLGLRATHPALAACGLALGLVAHFPAEAIDSLVTRYLPDPGQSLAEATLLTATSPARLVVVMLVVACVGPLVEELFFRGALFGALRQSHPLLGASCVTAVCFVVGHLDYHKWPALLVVAVVLTHLRAMSGSLLPSLAMHVAFNAVTVLAFFAGETVSDQPRPLDLLPTLLGFAATLALMFAVGKISSRVEEARIGRAEDAE
jgi:membrane protease YdiL (CAAX protease family)